MFPPVARSKHHAAYWRVKLVLHYEGRHFYGWQAQRDQRTVQGELSALLGRLCGDRSRKLTAAGRTDRGVHATGQVASALIPERFEADELRRALNALTPPDLWIAAAEPVPLGFHPRYDAGSRTYCYRVGVDARSRSPFEAPWCWPLARPLERELLDRAAGSIEGRHDFSVFAKSGQPKRGVSCHVLSAGWREPARANGVLEFEITADRFLHRMVRYLVGTMVEIGQGRRPADDIRRLLARGPGPGPAPPAPAQGLFLTRVDYSKEF